MTRRNRFDGSLEAQSVRNNPADYTRASRRAAGLRGGVHPGHGTILPRAVRRLLRDPLKAEARIQRNKAKVNRLLAPLGGAV